MSRQINNLKFYFAVFLALMLVLVFLYLNFTSQNIPNGSSSLPAEKPAFFSSPTIDLSKQIKIISPLQKTTAGITNEINIQELKNATVNELDEKTKEYTIPTRLSSRPDKIIVVEGRVVFEKTLLPVARNDPNYLKITTLLDIYGEPEKKIQGHLFWGPEAYVYIYATRGMAFVGNPNSSEVYELQVFVPSQFEDYLKKYGQDIKEGLKESPDYPPEKTNEENNN